jgi:glycine hydroxymethyltransferase
MAEALIAQDFRLVSGGTDNHLMLVDLSTKDWTGREAEKALETAGITVNKNSIPFDTESPRITSGVRLGTPAVTTRGMKEPEMGRIAEFIDRALEQTADTRALQTIRKEVRYFCRGFPLFPQIG